MTADLAAWLLADDGPIAEDERVAHDPGWPRTWAAIEDQWHTANCAADMAAEGTRCTCGVPARVLAECAAKRAVIEAWFEAADARLPEHDSHYAGGLTRALVLLAQPYAGREGWREEWRA